MHFPKTEPVICLKVLVNLKVGPQKKQKRQRGLQGVSVKYTKVSCV